MKYKGYTIFPEKDSLGNTKWSVGTIQPDGTMHVHARGFANTKAAKKAADAHFGRL